MERDSFKLNYIDQTNSKKSVNLGIREEMYLSQRKKKLFSPQMLGKSKIQNILHAFFQRTNQSIFLNYKHQFTNN